MLGEAAIRTGFGRREVLTGSLAALAVTSGTLFLGKLSIGEQTAGDLTDKLATAPADTIVTITSGRWAVSRSIRVAAKVRFAGGILRPDDGVIIDFDQDIDAPPGQHIFDLTNVRWVRGVQQMDSAKRQQTLWETGGNFRLPGIAYASWFGAQTGPGHDNTLALQSMLDSGARDAVLDGFYLHTANWVGDNQRLRGLAPFGEGTRSGLKTVPYDQSFIELLNRPNPSSPAEDSFRGLSTKSGIETAAFADFEYDGSAQEHFDHKTRYRNYFADESSVAEGAKSFRRQLMRQGGINIGQGDNDGAYQAPRATMIERVYIHDTVRSAIVANRAPGVTIRDCRLANSDVDHLIYADRNPDLLVENVTLSGYAHGAMVVISGGSLRNCVVRDLSANPIPGRVTDSIVWLRADLSEPTEVTNLVISGALEKLGNEDVQAKVFKLAGKRAATIRGLKITHTGSPAASFTVFGTQKSASAIQLDGLVARDMPAGATLWNTPFNVSDIVMHNIDWTWNEDTRTAPYLMRFGSLVGADFNNITLNGASLETLSYVERRARKIDTAAIRASHTIGRMVDAPGL